MAVGGLNTALGLGVIYGLMVLGTDYRLANAAGFCLGCAVSFVLNKSWTFRHPGSRQGNVAHSLARWLAVVAGGYGLNLLLAVVLHDGLGINAYLSQLGGMAAFTAVTFLGGRFFAFAPTPILARAAP